MPNKTPQPVSPLSARDALIGIAIATAAALVLLGTLGMLGSLASSAAARGGGVSAGGGGGGGGGSDPSFPIPAKHSYGDGFGAGRNHQGQDVFSRCGKRLLSAKTGRVQKRGFEGSAGHYIVIDTKKSKIDYVYMHLKRKARFGAGKRVRAGQRIGRVGDSGNAVGCHLHFEKWSGPGYYEGGSAQRSVTRTLKRWDRKNK